MTSCSGAGISHGVEQIRQTVFQKTREKPAADYSEFLPLILERYPGRVLGVFMYGSVLSAVTKSATSFPDFFVVTDGYRGVFKKFLHWLLAWVLPPHIYHLNAPSGAHCKYNLVSIAQFRRQCSAKADDIYILGRFGKRVALIWSRDQQAADELCECCFQAARAVALWTARGLSEPLTGERFARDCLNLSYRGETRVEAGSKVEKLFQAERDYYLAVYPRLAALDDRLRPLLEVSADGQITPRPSRWRRLRQRWFLKKSRIRGIARWPKFLITVEGWVDILLAKIERTKGIRIELTPRERKYPLIFGWKYFFRLLRAGAIRSAPEKPPSGEKEG